MPLFSPITVTDSLLAPNSLVGTDWFDRLPSRNQLPYLGQLPSRYQFTCSARFLGEPICWDRFLLPD